MLKMAGLNNSSPSRIRDAATNILNQQLRSLRDFRSNQQPNKHPEEHKQLPARSISNSATIIDPIDSIGAQSSGQIGSNSSTPSSQLNTENIEAARLNFAMAPSSSPSANRTEINKNLRQTASTNSFMAEPSDLLNLAQRSLKATENHNFSHNSTISPPIDFSRASLLEQRPNDSANINNRPQSGNLTLAEPENAVNSYKTAARVSTATYHARQVSLQLPSTGIIAPNSTKLTYTQPLPRRELSVLSTNRATDSLSQFPRSQPIITKRNSEIEDLHAELDHNQALALNNMKHAENVPGGNRFDTEKRKIYILRALFLFSCFYSLLEIAYIIVPGYNFSTEWPCLLLRLLNSAAIGLYSVCFYKNWLFLHLHVDSSLALLLSINQISLIVAEILRSPAFYTENSIIKDGLLLSLVIFSAFSYNVLKLRFVYSLYNAVAVFLSYNLLLFLTHNIYSTREILINDAYFSLILCGSLLICRDYEVYRREDLITKQLLVSERLKAEKLLRSMLPAQILEQFLDNSVVPYSSVATVGFCSIDLESNYARPSDLMQRLHDTFKRIDGIVNVYSIRGVNKIETVSKTYLLCAGLLRSDVDDHAAAMIDVCLEISHMISTRITAATRVSIKIGVATGPVVGGIIGENRKFFRVFGDTVNVASRMCSTAAPGNIQLTEGTFNSLSARQKLQYKVPNPALINVKGKGEMLVYTISANSNWIPQFSKSLMHRGMENHHKLLEKSFIYHKLIGKTKLHSYSLQFYNETSEQNTELEQLFQVEHSKSFLNTIKVVNSAFSLWLAAAAAFILQQSSSIGTILPILLAFLLFFTLIPAVLPFLAPFFYRNHLQKMLAGQIILFSAWIVIILSLTSWGLHGAVHPGFSFLSLVLYTCLLLRLQFIFAVPIISGAFLAFLLCLLTTFQSYFDIVLLILVLVPAISACFTVSRSFERQLRFNFLLKFAIQAEQNAMDEFLGNLLPLFIVNLLKKNTQKLPFIREKTKIGLTSLNDAEKDKSSQEYQLDQHNLPRFGAKNSISIIPTASVALNPRGMARHSELTLTLAPTGSQTSPTASGRRVSTLSPLPPASPSSPASAISILGASSRFAMKFPHATVFESDIVGYTALVSNLSAEQTLHFLNQLFSKFDSAAAENGVEKIETIGDAYMAMVFEGNADSILNFALQAVKQVQSLGQNSNLSAQIRSGIATGAVFGGILGSDVPRFHLFGSSHDLAIQLEQNGIAGEVLCSATVFEECRDRFNFRLAPDIIVNEQPTYLLNRKTKKLSLI
jgi:class 3 adenylate cyclase